MKESQRMIQSGEIEGVRLIDLTVHNDNRGWLCELVREDDDFYQRFGQLYVVNNYQANVVRAFHMHKEQDEIFIVTSGAIQFILVDEREDCRTFKTMKRVVMDGNRPQALTVPRGVQHGSMALVDGAQITALTTQPYRAGAPDEVRVPADHYGNIWGLGGW